MNVEVEIKARIVDFGEMKDKVSKVGSLAKAVRQIDEYYVPAHEDFFAKKPHPVEWLRIRTTPDKTVFEYTRSINMRENGDYDYAEEYETGITDPDEMRKILELLDFKKVVTVEKEREYWQCGNIEVALDKVKGLGDFIEVEAKGDFKSEVEAKEACLKFLESLGLEDIERKQILTGYPQLVMGAVKLD